MIAPQVKGSTGSPANAVSYFIVFYMACVGTTWWCYLRAAFLVNRMPSLASAKA